MKTTETKICARCDGNCNIHYHKYYSQCVLCHPMNKWPVRSPIRRYRLARREGYGIWDSLRYAVNREANL